MIGLFDSGIGGLAVARALRKALPAYDLVFLADTARSPYTRRSVKTTARYADEGLRHLVARSAGLVVICCSAAASALIEGRIGPYDVPIVDGVTSVVAAAVSVSKKHLFGVIGNRRAMECGVYERLVRDRFSDARVYTQSSILLDTLIEEGWTTRPETARIAKKLLHPLKVRQIDTLILDSPYLSAIEKKIAIKAGKKVYIVKSWLAVVDAVKTFLSENPRIDHCLGKSGLLKILVTDRSVELDEKCRYFLKSKAVVDCVQVGAGDGDVNGRLRD